MLKTMPPFKLLILAGIVLVCLGFICGIAQRFQWELFRLPGDIVIEKAPIKIYIPITSMVLISLVIHLLIRLFYWMGILH